MHQLLPLRYVAVGGAVGALTRWAALGLSPEARSTEIVIGLNLVGSVLLGVLVGRSKPRQGRVSVTKNQFLLVGTGFCGGLTTLSTLALDIATAIDAGAVARAGAITLATAVPTVVGAGLGYRMGRA